MKRILKFIFIFFLVATGLLGSIIWFGWDAFRTLHENRSGMAEGSEWIEDTYSMSGLVHFIGSNDHYISLQNLTIGGSITPLKEADKSPDLSNKGALYQGYGTHEFSLQLNPETPRTIGLVSSLYLMTAYAEGFASGAIDSSEIIDFNELSSWQLPMVHEQAHQALREIAEAQYPDLRIPLSELVSWLPASSDLALYDFLLNKIGSKAISDFYPSAGLEHTEPLVPFSGLYLLASEWMDGSMAPYSEEAFVEKKGQYLQSSESREWIHQYAWNRALQFHAGGPEIESWKKTLKKDRLGLSFMQERDALELFPRSSATDLIRFTEKLFSGELISAEASRQVFNWLSWAGLKSEPLQNKNLTILQTGSLYDSRMGLLSGLHLVRTRDLSEEKETIMIQTSIFESLPVALWFHLSANHMHQDFLQRLLSDSTLIQQTERMITTLEQE